MMNKSYRDIVHKQVDYFIFEIAKTYGLNRFEVVEEFKQYINQFKPKDAPEAKQETPTIEQSSNNKMIVKKLCSNCLYEDDADDDFNDDWDVVLPECDCCCGYSRWSPSEELLDEIKSRCKVKDSCDMKCGDQIKKQSMTCAILADLEF